MEAKGDKQSDQARGIRSLSGLERLTCEDQAEIMRKKSRYRELILSGRLNLPHGRAAQLLGPDCLYHLYSVSRSECRSKRRR